MHYSKADKDVVRGMALHYITSEQRRPPPVSLFKRFLRFLLSPLALLLLLLPKV